MSASNYPAGYDSLTDPTGSDPLDSLTVPHADQHADANSAIEAIQATLGLNPQGSSPTVRDRLANLTLDDVVSTTSLVVGTGSKVFTVNSTGQYIVGTRVRVLSAGTPANFVEGDITDITDLDVTVDADYYEGSGTITDWQFTVAGVRGATGATGAAGADGADGVGIPVGGTTGQALVKASNDDYDTTWGAASGGSAGFAEILFLGGM